MRPLLALALFAGGVVAAQDPPQLLRTAYFGSDVTTSDGMTISWTTVNFTATSTLFYGLPGGPMNSTTGDQAAYLPLEKGGMVHHHVSVTGLLPGTAYSWYCGDAAAGWSAVHNFTTATLAPSWPMEIPVYGDMGVFNSNNSMVDVGRLFGAATFIWHVGDISYADDAFLHYPLQFHYEKTYNQWQAEMEQYTANKAYMVNPGNHEAECHSPACILDSVLLDSLANFSAYNTRWRMPYKPSGSSTSMWHSFRVGSVHFLNINTETDFPGAPTDAHVHANGGFGDQLAWVEADLAAAAAARARGEVTWILAGGHRPIYSSGDADGSGVPSKDSTPAIQKAFEGLFNKYGVDLYICGHVHSYESIWPTYDSTNIVRSFDNPPYTTYIISGAAGNTEGHTAAANPAPWSRAHNSDDFGISRINILNETTLVHEFRRATDGSVLDSITLTRKH